MKLKNLLLLLLLCSLSFGGGAELYLKYCSSCHGEDRLGGHAPPLFPPFFNIPEERLYRIIREGAVGMPSFKELKEEEVKQIVEFIKSPVEKEKLRWDEERIKGSVERVYTKKVEVKNLKDYTLVVERGKNLVWVMEGERLLDKFTFFSMHGGIKFSKEGVAYIPSRDGWIGRYDPTKGELKRVRACIYLRNIAFYDGLLVASCWVPSRLVVFDSQLNYIKSFELHGRINAVYELYSRNVFILTFKDKPLVSFLDRKNLNLTYQHIEEPLEDFIIDPLEEYLIGSTRSGLEIYSLNDLRLVKELKALDIPHLASAYFWYSKGDFYFATPLLNKPVLSVWKAYSWEHVKDIPLDGNGFLARSSYGTPYVWVDMSTDSMLLLDKRSLEVKKFTPAPGKRVTHAEFTGDGRIAYVSVYEKEGALVLYDGVSLKKLGEFPANLPAGKYNFVNKSRYFEGAQFGAQVFMEKCWGCHHTTENAFGPSLRWSVQNREKALVIAQILNPENTYRLLGYSRNAMPRIELKEEELKALMKFMEALKDGWMD